MAATPIAAPPSAPAFPSAGQRAFAAIEVKRDAIAYALGVSPQAVSQYARGQTRPRLHVAIKIEEAYGVPCRAWKLDAGESPT